MSELSIGLGKVAPAIADPAEAAVVGKVFRRLIGFLFVLYVVSYLDRINIGYAALSMNKDLGLTATTFGFANTLLYITYFIFEVPSNLLMVRFGARKWIARIMITWGLAATATAFVVGPNSLYAVRCLVGLAEAGFVPGMLLYLSYWFPASHRARVMALFMTAMPATIIIGSPLSGWLLGLHGMLGLAGWRWLFIIEGLPSVLLGLACLWVLTDRPSETKWLSPEERRTLEAAIAREHAGAAAPGARIPWREMRGPVILLLSLIYFCLVASLNTYATWSAQIIRDVMGGQSSVGMIGLIGVIPPFFTLIAMPLWSLSADRFNERFLHTAGLFALAAVGWGVVVFASAPVTRLFGLVLVSVGGFTAMAIFWAFATSYLSRAGRPVGIGIISSAGILGSAVSPTVIGVLRDLTQNFNAGLWYTMVLLVVGIVALAVVQRRPLPVG
jgi:ACS family 4-hydroxyphenylacetate permease-like MFS transporter